MKTSEVYLFIYFGRRSLFGNAVKKLGHQPGIKLLAALILEVENNLIFWPGFSIRPIGRQSIPVISNGKNPGSQGNFCA